MPVTTDILATYKAPRQVMARLLTMGAHESRLLAFAMGGCGLMFIARLPSLAREAHLNGTDLNADMGGALMGLVFMLPLLLYALALGLHAIARLLKGQGPSHQARLALFWSVLAASPLMLLNGLVAGFIGPGVELSFVGGLWCAAVLWFLFACMRQAYWTRS